MSRRIAIVTALATLGLALVALTFIPLHATAQIGSTSGFVVDQTYDAVWGNVSPGATVTVARGTAYGAAQADGVGFFWTPLWQSNGQPADITGTDAIQVYVNGSLSATITVSGVTGLVDVLNDRVVGTISGAAASTPVTVTLGTNPGVPSASATTDASGRFTATFTTVDLNPGRNAVVEYRNGPHTLRAFLAPSQVFGVGLGWNDVSGYAQPGQTVTATVYAGSGPAVKTVMTGQANKPQGYYDLKPSDDTVINGGDVVKVNLGSGVTISTTAVTITMHTNPTTDLVTGTAPAGAALRASLSQWTDDKNLYYQVTTIADATGVYTANFSGLADVQVYDWIGVAVADSKGNETNLWSGAPMISVDESDNSVWTRVDGPNMAVAATLDTGSGTFTQTGTSGLHHFVSLGRFPGEPDIQPGHHITVETVSWTGVITVANLSASLDTAGNRLLGNAPAGRAQAEIYHAWSDRYPAGLGGVIQQITVTSPFTLTYANFDVRDGDGVWLTSHDSNGFDTGRWIDSRVFQVQVPNGVWSPQLSSSDVLTATLYASNGVTVKHQTSQDNDSDPNGYWLDMQGEIAVGDWVTVTDGAGWTAGLQVPTLTAQANAATDLIWGKGPKSLLLIQRNWDWQSARFVPCDDYKLDAAYFGEDLLSSDRIQTMYFALNGNRVVSEFEFPWTRVNYGHDWVEANYETGHTVWITLTNSGGAVKATAVLTTGVVPGWGGQTGFSTNWQGWIPSQPDIVPGDWVYVRVDDGYASTVRVGTITGNVSSASDSISGTITANWFTQTLNARCEVWMPSGPPGIDMTVNPNGGSYSCDFGAVGWDVLPGQDVAVLYSEPDRDQVINMFHEPAPNLRVEKWVEGGGEVAPGGPVIFGIRYWNQGDGAGEAILTDTLPSNTTYITDTSGRPAFVSSGIITWNLGSLTPGVTPVQFQLVLTNSASTDDTLNNQVDIGAQYETDWGDNHAEAQVHVGSGQPDLQVDKNPNPGDPAPGQLFRYDINYNNNGSVASGPVWLTDTLPLSTTFVSWQSDNGYGLWTTVVTTGGKVALYAPTLPGNYGDRIFLTLRLSDTAPYGTQLINTIEITTTDDSNPDDNQQVNDRAWVSPPHYDVSVDKSWGYGALTPGGELNYNLNYNNSGNSPAHNVVVTDTLPAGTTFITSVIDLGWGVTTPFLPSNIVGNQLAWNLGTLGVNANNNWRITLRLDAATSVGTVITNCATIAMSDFEDNPYDNDRCVTETVRAAGPNLRVDKFADWQGTSGIQYRVRIGNIGTETLYNVTITDTYPISMTMNWWNVNCLGRPCSSSPQGSNPFTVTFSQLDPGATTWLNMGLNVPVVPNGDLFTNTAEITTPPGDVNPADNRSVLVVGTGPDLNIEKSLTGGSSTPMPGDLLTYTLHFQNESEWQMAGTAWMTDVLPIGLEFVTSTQRLCGGGTYFCPRAPDYSDGTRSAWSNGTLGNYEWNDIIVTARVTSTAQGGDVLTNTAIIASDNSGDVEPYYDDNTSTYPVTVLNPKFEIGKAYTGSLVAGMPLTYTVIVTNVGNELATNVVVTDAVPVNGVYVSGGSLAGGVVSWNVGAVSPGNPVNASWVVSTCQFSLANQWYRVASSDQGVTSNWGQALALTIISPTLTANFIAVPTSTYPNQSVTFTATATTNGLPVATYTWAFGDGGTGAGRVITHAYTQTGAYTVTLMAIDPCGFSAGTTINNAVTVTHYKIYLPVVMRH